MTNNNTTTTVRVKRSRRKQKKKNFFSEFLAGNQKFLFFRLKPKVEPPKQRGRSRRRVKKKKHVKLKIFLSSIGLAFLYSHFAPLISEEIGMESEYEDLLYTMESSNYEYLISKYGIEFGTFCNASDNNELESDEIEHLNEATSSNMEREDVYEVHTTSSGLPVDSVILSKLSNEIEYEPEFTVQKELKIGDMKPESIQLSSANVEQENQNPKFTVQNELKINDVKPESLELTSSLNHSSNFLNLVQIGASLAETIQRRDEQLKNTTNFDLNSTTPFMEIATPSNASYEPNSDLNSLESSTSTVQSVGIATPSNATLNKEVGTEYCQFNAEELSNAEVSALKEVIIKYCQFNEADYQTFMQFSLDQIKKSGVENVEEQNVLEYFYHISQVPIEEKIAYILEKYRLTYEEFLFVAAVFMAEGKWESYLDVYAVTDTGKNRCKDGAYCIDFGSNIYSQVMGRGQFSVIRDGRVYQFIGKTDMLAFQAVVDSLYSSISLHNCLEFRGTSEKNFSGLQFTPRGNRFGGRNITFDVQGPMILELPIQEEEYVKTLVP